MDKNLLFAKIKTGEIKMLDHASIRLFKSVVVQSTKNHVKNSQSSILYGIQKRVVFHPSIKITKELCDFVHDLYFIAGNLTNNSFHKSWSIIDESSQTKLVEQAMLHYFTTYGLEDFGVLRKDLIYIPYEELEVPDLKENVPMVYIDAITIEETIEKIIDLGSGIALKNDTLNDIMIIVDHIKNYLDYYLFTKRIKNRELRILLYNTFNIVPEKAEEFFKYCVYVLTGETQIIKNKYLIERIKMSDKSRKMDELLKYAPKDLASIFFRYKPLFLAMKYISRNRTFFNRLRKQANKMHQPVPENYMVSVTQRILNNSFNRNNFLKDLEKSNVFQIIRLINGLKYRLVCEDGDFTSYQIRNGKLWVGFVNDFNVDQKQISKFVMSDLYSVLYQRLGNNIDNKIFYMPENIEYSVPTTEKQFIGNIPFGSKVYIKNNMVFGIHWFNNSNRVDLDLSTMDISGKVGWDSYYKQGSNILFSGDMTDASGKNGASELFYVSKNYNGIFSILNNYYNYRYKKANYKFFIAESDDMLKLKKNYMVDPNNIKVSVNMDIGNENQTIGLVNKDENLEFYFYNTSMGTGITSINNELQTQARLYLIKKMKNQLSLKELIQYCGGKIVTEIPDEEYIDLSVENLSKDSILNILKD
jgi:hypothetical protein